MYYNVLTLNNKQGKRLASFNLLRELATWMTETKGVPTLGFTNFTGPVYPHQPCACCTFGMRQLRIRSSPGRRWPGCGRWERHCAQALVAGGDEPVGPGECAGHDTIIKESAPAPARETDELGPGKRGQSPVLVSAA